MSRLVSAAQTPAASLPDLGPVGSPAEHNVLGPSCPAKPPEQGWVLSAAGVCGQVVPYEEKPERDNSNDTNIFKTKEVVHLLWDRHVSKRD